MRANKVYCTLKNLRRWISSMVDRCPCYRFEKFSILMPFLKCWKRIPKHNLGEQVLEDHFHKNFSLIIHCCFILSIVLFPGIVAVKAQSTSIQDLITVKANKKEVPPKWALMQRKLINTIDEAAPLYLEKFTYGGGTMRRHGKLDDDYESFISWPLFYAIGGDDRFLEWSLKQFNAITRQWTYQHQKSVGKEFVKHYDMLHLSEGYVGFQYFGLADPSIPENIDRARRFAGFYMNEDSDAKNFDPTHNIIRSPITGSAGPKFEMEADYILNYGHASLYPAVKDLEPGWDEDPKRHEEIQQIYNDVVISGDVPMNLAVTGLVTHAYIQTGDAKYKDWVLNYVEGWMKRIKQNNGIIPDNIGPTGKIGENRNGQWWGGFFGWSGRYSVEMIFKSLITATECSYIMTGDSKYLDLLRSQVGMLFSMQKTHNGDLLVPYKHGPDGWYDYRPFEPYILGHLWRASMNKKDWERIEKLKKGKVHGPAAYAYASSPNPPEPGSEVWHSDGTRFDWNEVRDDLYGNQQRQMEAPHLSFLAGTNPDWPQKVLKAEYEHVVRNIERIRTGIYEADWTSQTILFQNPVRTTGLAQMTMGAPFTNFNGGLLRARVRYYDLERKRPGLPEDVAALVEKLEADRAVVHLVNTSGFNTRKLIIQAGAYREHEFTKVKYTKQTEDHEDKISETESSVEVNNDFFAIELPPNCSIKLDLGMRRFVHQPTYKFPWHAD